MKKLVVFLLCVVLLTIYTGRKFSGNLRMEDSDLSHQNTFSGALRLVFCNCEGAGVVISLDVEE